MSTAATYNTLLWSLMHKFRERVHTVKSAVYRVTNSDLDLPWLLYHCLCSGQWLKRYSFQNYHNPKLYRWPSTATHYSFKAGVYKLSLKQHCASQLDHSANYGWVSSRTRIIKWAPTINTTWSIALYSYYKVYIFRHVLMLQLHIKHNHCSLIAEWTIATIWCCFEVKIVIPMHFLYNILY